MLSNRENWRSGRRAEDSADERACVLLRKASEVAICALVLDLVSTEELKSTSQRGAQLATHFRS